MNINAAFPSNFVKAADLNGKRMNLVIKNCIVEDIGDDRKPVLYFERAEKGLVLNKTNAMAISSAFGDDTDDWTGQTVEMFPDKTMYQGRMVDCLRVRPIPSTQQKQQHREAAPFGGNGGTSPAPRRQPATRQAEVDAPFHDDMPEDQVPF